METGSIVSWKKKEGDKVVEGDLLAEIETDKAVMGFEAQEAGFIAKILVAQGTRDIKLGTPLLAIVSKQDLVAAFKDIAASDISGPALAASAPASSAPASSSAASAPPPPQPSTAPSPPPASAAPTSAPASAPATGPIAASPYAKTLAQQKGVDLRMVRGTGPNGEITAKDVESAAAAPPAPPVSAPSAPISVPPGVSFVDIQLTGFRKTIAKRLTQSKQTIPHYYLSKEIRIDQILKLRAELNADLQAEAKAKKEKGEPATKLSVNDFVMKASALACRRVPEVNSAWMDNFIRQYNQVDLSMAVATSQGLITPIIFNADTKGLVQINKDAVGLAKLAREGKLQPPQFQGGSFTVSNLGMFGISFFTAVINPPQSCILAVGGAEKRVVLDDKEPRGFRAADVVTVTLSCDHRVVDGAVGAEWLQQLQKLLESPYHMLL